MNFSKKAKTAFVLVAAPLGIALGYQALHLCSHGIVSGLGYADDVLDEAVKRSCDADRYSMICRTFGR